MCRPFREIYTGGQQLCERMFGSAFVYSESEGRAFTMWFDDPQDNPNDRAAVTLDQPAPEACLIQYFHRDIPAKATRFLQPNACPPWREHGCCSPATVESVSVLKGMYGREFQWDRCGPLTPECEHFFVAEACFYECDVNMGLYRKYPEGTYDPRCDKKSSQFDAAFSAAHKCNHNSWEVEGMPIKASFCNAWFNACSEDFFCAEADGNFFSCAVKYRAHDGEL